MDPVDPTLDPGGLALAYVARRATVAALPRRVAHATHALISSSSPYAFGVGLRTTEEVLLHDVESISLGSTHQALLRAMRRYSLVDSGGVRPRLWFPTTRALDLRGALEERFLAETEREGDRPTTDLVTTLDPEIVKAIAHCRLGGNYAPQSTAFLRAIDLGLLARDPIWRATERGEGVLVALGMLDGEREPERLLTTMLWATRDDETRPHFVAAWARGLRRAAEREFAAFANAPGDWTFWTTTAYVEQPQVPR